MNTASFTTDLIDWKIAAARSKIRRDLSYSQAAEIWSDLCLHVQDSTMIIDFLIKLRENLIERIGERKQYYFGIKWLVHHQPNWIFTHFQKIVGLCSWYWKDLLNIWETCEHELLRSWIIYTYCKQLQTLFKNFSDARIGTVQNQLETHNLFAAKWAPTEGCSLDKRTGIIKLFCEQLRWTPRDYRQRIARLRNEMPVIERLLCDQRWGEIDFDSIPVKARQRYHNTLLKHCGRRYSKWLLKRKQDLDDIYFTTAASGITIMRNLRTKQVDSHHSWSLFADQNKLTEKHFGKCLCVCNVGPEMFWPRDKPIIDQLLAMTILITGNGNGKIAAYSNNPQIRDLKGETITEKIEDLLSLRCDKKIDLIKLYDQVLKHAEQFDHIYIFSHAKLDLTIVQQFNCPVFYINLKHKWNSYEINIDHYSKGWVIFNGFSETLFEHFVAHCTLIK